MTDSSRMPPSPGRGDEGGGRYPRIDPDSLDRGALIGMIDYTLLKPEETAGEYSRFLEAAARWGFRTVFIPPCYVPLAVRTLEGTGVTVGTPVSFPFGYASPEVKVAEALLSLGDGAREIDVVMNISAALSGEWETVEEDLAAVVSSIRGREGRTPGETVVVKVILETPYLDDEQKTEACRRAVAAGMDFVKTATGLGPGGATAHDIRLMRGVVGDGLGVKASGGIRTWADARAMISAGASRIGTSAGPKLVEDFTRATS